MYSKPNGLYCISSPLLHVNRLGVVGYLLYFIYFLSFVSFTFSACTGATRHRHTGTGATHMAFFYFVSFTFSACTEGIRLVLYINSINFTSTY
jgi:hypothetical protein